MAEVNYFSGETFAGQQEAMDLIITLKAENANFRTEQNSQHIAFDKVLENLEHLVADSKTKTGEEQLKGLDLISNTLNAVRTIGLKDLPDAVKPPAETVVSPAATAPLGEKVTPDQVQVTADKQILISSSKLDNVIPDPTILVSQDTEAIAPILA